MEALGFSMIKFPDMRKELLEHLAELADRKYQENCWVKKQCPVGIEYDELDYSVHFLFDDTQLSENPESMVGYCLNNEQEVKAISLVCRSLDQLFGKYGYDKSDEEYISCPEWQYVIDAAREALSVFNGYE